ncbi:hypothetical protein PYCC9005_001963 [Savitreella phatthalungensis]
MKTTPIVAAAAVLLTGADAAPALPQWLRRGLDKLITARDVDWNSINYDFSGVNWNTVSYDFSNVDWKTVNYGAPAAATPAAAQAAPAATTAAAAPVVDVPAAAPVVVAATTTVAPAVVAATPTTTLVKLVAQTTVTSSNSGTKRGLGWDPSSNSAYASKFGKRASWYFNWSPTPSANMPSNWEFFANIWGSGGIDTLASRLTGKPKLIGFNEPDSASQANLDANTAVSLYKQYLTGLKSQGKISQLGTPAITNSVQPGQGLQWLSSFMSGCKDCGLDFAVVHWYAESLDDFKNFVTQAHAITGLPINVAEFAYTAWNAAAEPSAADVMSFMQQATAWLDAQPFVVNYAWFGSMFVSEAKYPALGSANSLITEDLSSLTALGAAYSN